MDWGVRRGTATVVAVSDGTASIDYSTGGGAIGGAYARPGVRRAAAHAVAIAGKFLGRMQLLPIDTSSLAAYTEFSIGSRGSGEGRANRPRSRHCDRLEQP